MNRELARVGMARVLHKAIRQFESEGCPEVFDLKVHIDMMLKRLEESGYRLIPELKVLRDEGVACIMMDSERMGWEKGKDVAQAQRDYDKSQLLT